MMTKLKLHYFDIRGRGEGIRLIFKAAGVDFEDVRITFDEWGPDIKNMMPTKQVPCLEINGMMFPESTAIQRYLGREYNLAGKTSLDALKVDVIIAYLEEVIAKYGKIYRIKDEEEKAKSIAHYASEIFPEYLKNLDGLVASYGKNGYMVGDSLTVADLAFYNAMDVLATYCKTPFDLPSNLQQNKQKVEDHPKLKEYIATRK